MGMLKFKKLNSKNIIKKMNAINVIVIILVIIYLISFFFLRDSKLLNGLPLLF
jgi:hypothetical protein